MILQQKAGALHTIAINGRHIDRLPLQWYETSKRILHKQTVSGKDITLKFLQQNPAFTQDDVLYADEHCVIAVDILPCDAIVITPRSMQEMASICYEIGNKHLPLFYEASALLTPYEDPLFRLLSLAGFAPVRETRQLLQPLKTSVAPHGYNNNGFSLQLFPGATPAADA